MSGVPQQPYFLRALYEWCLDSGLTPYVSVRVDARTRVPRGVVKDGMVVLNIGPAAVRDLHVDNEWLTFSARFGGVAQTLDIPTENVQAIYARETGEGMAFDALLANAASNGSENVEAGVDRAENETPPPAKGRPSLKIVK